MAGPALGERGTRVNECAQKIKQTSLFIRARRQASKAGDLEIGDGGKDRDSRETAERERERKGGRRRKGFASRRSL